MIIYGARRFSNYKGYSDTFEHLPLKRVDNKIGQKSILIAIDAIDFSKYQAPHYQYCKKAVRREINKAVAGFQGAGLEDDEMPVVTGRWGCGAFGGDEELKFLIQWVAASESGREMVFITDDKEKMKELSIVVRMFQIGRAHV